ncbi:MAG TPA: peptidylprolyl isomerase, partial [Gemmatales bacterium]|nr:peptidylprolyl isomerase [Gemmatales bacterium]
MLALLLACSLASQSPPVPPPEGVKVSPDRLVIQTKAGFIVIALYPEMAPKHVVQIMRLVKAGVYDGTCIARIEPRFVLQFSAAENDKEPSLTSTQKAMLEPIDAEFSSLKHVRGVVSMAREDNKPNSARTSFSILLGDAPHLDGQYTIFGHVEYGMDVVEELIKAPLLGTRPRERLTVTKMQLVDGQELQENPPPPARILFSSV